MGQSVASSILGIKVSAPNSSPLHVRPCPERHRGWQSLQGHGLRHCPPHPFGSLLVLPTAKYCDYEHQEQEEAKDGGQVSIPMDRRAGGWSRSHVRYVFSFNFYHRPVRAGLTGDDTLVWLAVAPIHEKNLFVLLTHQGLNLGSGTTHRGLYQWALGLIVRKSNCLYLQDSGGKEKLAVTMEQDAEYHVKTSTTNKYDIVQ